METRRLIWAVAALAGSYSLATTPALALSGLALMPSTALMIAGAGQQGCALAVQPALGRGPVATPAGPLGPLSKSSAILGGQMSRLEMIARQQDATGPAGLTAPVPVSTLAASPLAAATQCPQLALPTASPFKVAPGIESRPLETGDFLASKRLPVRKTVFDAQWRRVSQGRVSRRLAATLEGSMRGGASQANLAAINSLTNARVRFVEDRQQYGRADYWASAEATLRRRAGDCEDIAIAKMQLLGAIGVPASDMYLTIARDLARNADHAMLVVRLDGRFWLLDNATDELLDASRSYDYRPILSYNSQGKWLHGYQAAAN
jgi:predicted transglutaminase-like cysteine proteinase